MLNKVRAWESQILRLTAVLQGLVGVGRATAHGQNCEQRGPCMMVMSRWCWLFIHFWSGERLHGGELDPHGVGRGTPPMSEDGSIKLGSTTEVYSGTHRWRGGLVSGRTG